MKENNKQTTCEQTSSFTQVNTTYARICVLLLALNFCITGYVLSGVLKLQQEASTQTSMTSSPTMKAEVKKMTTPSIPAPTLEVETREEK